MAHGARKTVIKDLPYGKGVEMQKTVHARVAAETEGPGEVLFVQHRPVITCGRSGDGSNLLATPEKLASDGIDYFPSSRGGDVTYHGPGQWTVYPIVRLAWYDKDLHRYLRLMEECVIRFLAAYGVASERREGLTGVWVDGGKVAAVGVAVNRWVTWHGLAVNIMPDLDCFTRYMHPCGIRAEQGGVTSLSALTDRPYSLEETLPALQTAVANVLDLTWVE